MQGYRSATIEFGLGTGYPVLPLGQVVYSYPQTFPKEGAQARARTFDLAVFGQSRHPHLLTLLSLFQGRRVVGLRLRR